MRKWSQQVLLSVDHVIPAKAKVTKNGMKCGRCDKILLKSLYVMSSIKVFASQDWYMNEQWPADEHDYGSKTGLALSLPHYLETRPKPSNTAWNSRGVSNCCKYELIWLKSFCLTANAFAMLDYPLTDQPVRHLNKPGSLRGANPTRWQNLQFSKFDRKILKLAGRFLENVSNA